MKENVLGSIRLFLALTVLLGGAYPFVVWGIGRVAFREKADGSFLRREEKDPQSQIVGSQLIGQSFSSKKFFHGRPSAAGDAGYDPTNTGGTNLGPTSKKLADAIRDKVGAVRGENPEPGASGPLPADASRRPRPGWTLTSPRSTRASRFRALRRKPVFRRPTSRRSSAGTSRDASSASTARAVSTSSL